MESQFFLKIDASGIPEIRGESAVPGFIGWIEVEAYSLGVSQRGSQVGTIANPAEKKILEGFSIVKYLDQSSPSLFSMVTHGYEILSFTLVGTTVEGGGRRPFVRLEDRKPQNWKPPAPLSYVTGIAAGGGGSDTPLETVIFTLANPVWTHLRDGKVIAPPSSPPGTAVKTGAAIGVAGAAPAGAWKVKKHPPLGSVGSGGIGGFKRPPVGK